MTIHLMKSGYIRFVVMGLVLGLGVMSSAISQNRTIGMTLGLGGLVPVANENLQQEYGLTLKGGVVRFNFNYFLHSRLDVTSELVGSYIYDSADQKDIGKSLKGTIATGHYGLGLRYHFHRRLFFKTCFYSTESTIQVEIDEESQSKDQSGLAYSFSIGYLLSVNKNLSIPVQITHLRSVKGSLSGYQASLGIDLTLL